MRPRYGHERRYRAARWTERAAAGTLPRTPDRPCWMSRRLSGSIGRRSSGGRSEERIGPAPGRTACRGCRPAALPWCAGGRSGGRREAGRRHGGGNGLSGDRRRFGGLRGRQPAQRDRRAGRVAGSGAARLASLDPRSGRRAQAAAQPARELELRDGAGGGQRRPRHPLAAGPGARRVELHQRHALRARQPGRLRRLGADGLPRLELRRRAALLPQVGALRPRRSGLPRQGRRAAGGGLPDDPAADAPLRGGGAAGRARLPARPERGGAGRGRLLADDAQRALPGLHGADLPGLGEGAAEPARGDRRGGDAAALRGPALRGRRVPPGGADAGDPRGAGGGAVRRRRELAAPAADLGGRPGGAPAEHRRGGGERARGASAPTCRTTTSPGCRSGWPARCPSTSWRGGRGSRRRRRASRCAGAAR